MKPTTNITISDQRNIYSPLETADPLPRLRSALSLAEWEIATRILKGQSTKQIAMTLFRSVETIQNHRKNIRSKLGIRGGKLALIHFLKNHINEQAQHNPI